MDETILSVLPGNSEHDRVVMVHRRGFGVNTVILRRESFSEAIGWFEQNAVELSTDQVGQLKQSLGVLPSSAGRTDRAPRRATAAFPRYAAHGLSVRTVS